MEGIGSDESDNAVGVGDGNTHNDMQAADGSLDADDRVFLLRAERAGKGDGRIYTITFRVTDDAGNDTVASCTVEVPHNASGHTCDDPDCDLNND